jgi:glutathione reductase (NADPH)
MNKKLFDLVVIGTGGAGATVASECRSAGWRVAIIDSRPFGGTCALRGCVPKKVLVGAAEVLDWARRMKGNGIQSDKIGIDWSDLMHFKRSFTGPFPKHREEAFTKSEIATFHGHASFIGPTTVQVGTEVLESRHVVIATGATPKNLNIPGAEYVTTSDQFLDIHELPSSIIFIGGGYISFEFSHIAARAGSQVTILHRGSLPLENFDPDLVTRLLMKSRQEGIDVSLNTRVEAVEKTSGSLNVHTSTNGKKIKFRAEMVVHGAGRVPDVDDLNLSKAGITVNPRGIEVNEFLQSVSNPAIYAAGDVAASGGLPLTPVAGQGGEIVAANLLKGNHLKMKNPGVPSVVFTIPPLAGVGFLERDARKEGLRFHIKQGDTSSWYSSRRVRETCSGFKVLIEEGTNQILGAHLLGPNADEVINLFALAIQNGIDAKLLKNGIFSYPSHGSDIEYFL